MQMFLYKSKKFVDPFDMKVDDIDLQDIIYSLSNQPRFNGHTLYPWSVWKHSMFVSQLVRNALKDTDCSKEILEDSVHWAVLHDASEAYLGDIPTPVKAHLPQFKEAEKRIMDLIVEKFELIQKDEPTIVKIMDTQALLIEALHLCYGGNMEEFKKHGDFWGVKNLYIDVEVASKIFSSIS